MQKVVFNAKSNSFYASLRQDVERYFEEHRLAKTGNYQLYLKTLILLPASVALYVILVWFTPASTALALGLCSLLGIVSALIGFNVMHDASHGSYSSNATVCKVLSHTMNYLGSLAFFWNTKHNVLHHTYTNIDGVDSDIVQTKLLRLAPSQAWRPMHRYQHIYSIFLYALSHAAWILYNDFEKYFSQKVLHLQLKGFDTKQHIVFWVTKILYITMYLLVPFYFVGILPTLLGFAVLSATCGICLTVVFQLAHVVEITEFEDGQDGVVIEEEWAIHQINTTANFAMDNRVVSWLLGGLNFQVEHHLFPKISHVHYPALHQIVKQNCQKFGVPYRSFDSLGEAVASHFKMLKIMGQTAVVTHRPTVALA